MSALWTRDLLRSQAERAERGIELVPRADRAMVGRNRVVEGGPIPVPGLDMAALVRRHNAAAQALHAE